MDNHSTSKKFESGLERWKSYNNGEPKFKDTVYMVLENIEITDIGQRVVQPHI